MSYTMSDRQRRAFLMEGTRTAKIATTRADGRPHVAPVWFVLDGDDVIFTTGAESLKGKSLRRDPRVSLAVDDDAAPFGFVVVDGVAELSDEPAELLRWATAISARYMGTDRAEDFGRRNAVPGELMVRVHPTHMVAIGGMTD
jgi:PPOX class probable F420-dependent enzyme